MKRALLVGIDDYPDTGADLKSCVNDVMGWRTLLIERYGFFRENIRLLVNSRATKAEVLKRLRWIKTDTKAGDTLVFVYSGHGTTFTERDGIGFLDEARDEALRLNGEYGKDSLLLDDELFLIFKDILPEINLTIICDSCYSGGMLDEKSLALPPDLDHRNDPKLPLRIFGCCLPREENLKAYKKDNYSPSKSLLISACREDQVAAANRPATEGLSVFSYFAIREIRDSRSPLTARQLIYRTSHYIQSAGYSQVPRLIGRQDLFDKPLFDGIGPVNEENKNKEGEAKVE